MKKFIKENWFKISIIILLFIVSISYSLNQFTIYKSYKKDDSSQTKNLVFPDCDFEIIKGETYKGVFRNSKNSGGFINFSKGDQYWVTYTGTIKNKSDERQYLEAIILKMYDKNDVYIDDQFDMKRDWVEPNKLFSYELHLRSTKIDIRDESFTKVDIYPWFKTCK
ncbi:MAG: hypothetical protein KAT05_09570 [Spirochaetes bacterium]|nr:hypothetical protein [Spirochaetota bacterium]